MNTPVDLNFLRDEVVSKTLTKRRLSALESQIATTDQLALKSWLGAYKLRSKHTVRTYEKEAVRFLMWLDMVNGISDSHLPHVTVENINDYIDFVINPRKFPDWVLKRYDRKYQPFKFALSYSSIRQMIVILYAMFSALQNVRNNAGSPYISINPMVLVKSVVSIEEFDSEKALSQFEWLEVQKSIELLPKANMSEQHMYYRTKWMFQLLYHLWLRRSEAADLKMGQFVKKKAGWDLIMIGKGKKRAKLIVTDELLNDLIDYRIVNGLSPYPALNESTPVLISLKNKQRGIGTETIYNTCKTIFCLTADRLNNSHPESSARLLEATPHWIRHTGISHALERNLDIRYVQAQARHSSVKMTSKYDHKERDTMRVALNKANNFDSDKLRQQMEFK